jgi:hypothetical protein
VYLRLADALATVVAVPDDHFALMLRGRLKFEQGKAMAGELIQ